MWRGKGCKIPPEKALAFKNANLFERREFVQRTWRRGPLLLESKCLGKCVSWIRAQNHYAVLHWDKAPSPSPLYQSPFFTLLGNYLLSVEVTSKSARAGEGLILLSEGRRTQHSCVVPLYTCKTETQSEVGPVQLQAALPRCLITKVIVGQLPSFLSQCPRVSRRHNSSLPLRLFFSPPHAPQEQQ